MLCEVLDVLFGLVVCGDVFDDDYCVVVWYVVVC